MDECYIGGLEEGLPGRLNLGKALTVVVAHEDGPGDRSDSDALEGRRFVRKPGALCARLGRTGSVIRTDGWLGYLSSNSKGYNEITLLKRKRRRLLRS